MYFYLGGSLWKIGIRASFLAYQQVLLLPRFEMNEVTWTEEGEGDDFSPHSSCFFFKEDCHTGWTLYDVYCSLCLALQYIGYIWKPHQVNFGIQLFICYFGLPLTHRINIIKNWLWNSLEKIVAWNSPPIKILFFCNKYFVFKVYYSREYVINRTGVAGAVL